MALLCITVSSNASAAAKKYDLHRAVLDQDIALIKKLLSLGADINEVGSRSFRYGSALHLAVREGYADIAILLLDRGAEVDVLDPNDFTPLHNAAWNGNLELVKYLLDAGADIEASTYDGDTPLSLAQNNNQPEVAEFIQAKLQPSATSEVKVESVATNDTSVIDISGTYTNTELTYPSLVPRHYHPFFFGDGSNLKITIKQSGNAITGVISGENPGEFKGVIKGREITIESSMNSAHATFVSGKGTWLVSNDGDALTGSYRLFSTSFGNVIGNWNYGDVIGNWNFRKIQAEPGHVVDVSGTYISEISVFGSGAVPIKNFMKKKNGKEITLEQTGNAISGVDSTTHRKVIGIREGNTIKFSIFYGDEINGTWEINAGATEIAGKWSTDGHGGASGIWNLTRIE